MLRSSTAVFLASAAAFSSACSEEGTCLFEPLSRVEPLGPRTACEYGGTLVHVGADENCNGMLESLEANPSGAGYLDILENGALQSVLELTSLERVSGSFGIEDNPMLPTSSAETLSQRVMIGDEIVIDGNGPG